MERSLAQLSGQAAAAGAAAAAAVGGLVKVLLEKNLQDLVKGLRSSPDEAAYIAKELLAIKEELKSRDVVTKATALQKLTYLHMLGHDMSWASFYVIETMTQDRFALKRIGFLAASQSFTSTTDVLVLCTQLLKKEFQAKSPYEIGLAINCLSNIATEDLARDLLQDVTMMLTSSRAYIRKKATLVLYKCYLRFPQGLRLTFDHLQRRLSDDNVSVVSCAVNVICELARKKPSNYLTLAPDLFALLTSASNNWMLIKVAKLMSVLVQEEPRLARKLLEPLANIVQTTPAKSLMYEAISTLTYALQHTKRPDGSDAKNVPAVVRLCTDKLREMVREPDQNLKYLGLTGLMNLMRSHPRVVAEHRELVLQCLTDEDVTIRLRALELITGMVTRRNLQDIVKRLLELLEGAEGHWREELIEKVIFICSRDKYSYLSDFSWYIRGVLSKLCFIQGTRHSAAIAGQLLDVAVRVEDVRPEAVQQLLPMLADPLLASNARTPTGAAAAAAAGGGSAAAAGGALPGSAGPEASSLIEEGTAAAALSTAGNLGAGAVLYAAAWISGEYCSVIPPAMHSPVLDALLHPGNLTLPSAVQGVYIQAALKILSAAASHALEEAEEGSDSDSDSESGSDSEEEEEGGSKKKGGDAAALAAATASFLKLAGPALEKLQPFAQSPHVEVQERACLIQQLLASLGVPFKTLPAPASAAAAKAAAEDLMAFASAGSPASPAPAGGAAAAAAASVVLSSLPPLEADIRIIGGVLASFFSEPLRPVNPKAQKRVPVPEGLDLDAWIRPEEQRAAEAELSGGSGRKGGSSSFRYESISFEESYNAAGGEEGSSEEDSPRKGGKKGSKKAGGAAGSPSYNVSGGADADDDEWFSGMMKQKKQRDKELWGETGGKEGGSKKDKKDKKEKKEKKGGSSSTPASDPFILKSSGGGRERHNAGGADAAAEDDDVEGIPIKKLELGGAAGRPSLDIGIFGDFGAKKGSKKEKEGKKAAGSKKAGKKDGSGSDSDAAPAKGKGKGFKIADDEDMPEGVAGAGSSSEEGASPSKKAGSSKKAAADSLADVDLSSPLREDEKLPERQHRSVIDPAAAVMGGAGRGRGRARVLGEASAPAPAAAPAAEEKKSKKDKKEKKEKKEEAAPAPAAEEENKSSKKEKKEKKDKKESAAAAASEPAVPVLVQGEAHAASPAHSFPLFSDKTVAVTFSCNAIPAPSTTPAGAAAGSHSSGCVALSFRISPRSSKKAVDFVDLRIVGETAAPAAPAAGAAAAAGPAVQYVLPRIAEGGAALPAGEEAGQLRLAAGLKEKSKSKDRSQTAVLRLRLPELAADAAPGSFGSSAAAAAVEVSYRVTGSSTIHKHAATLILPSAALLLPTVIEADSYRSLMTTEGASFTHAAVLCPFAAGQTAESAIGNVAAVLRSFAVGRSPRHAILYARTFSGAHVTALVKEGAAPAAGSDAAAAGVGGQLELTVKSVIAGHAYHLAEEVKKVMEELVAAATAGAAAGASAEDKE